MIGLASSRPIPESHYPYAWPDSYFIGENTLDYVKAHVPMLVYGDTPLSHVPYGRHPCKIGGKDGTVFVLPGDYSTGSRGYACMANDPRYDTFLRDYERELAVALADLKEGITSGPTYYYSDNDPTETDDEEETDQP